MFIAKNVIVMDFRGMEEEGKEREWLSFHVAHNAKWGRLSMGRVPLTNSCGRLEPPKHAYLNVPG